MPAYVATETGKILADSPYAYRIPEMNIVIFVHSQENETGRAVPERIILKEFPISYEVIDELVRHGLLKRR